MKSRITELPQNKAFIATLVAVITFIVFLPSLQNEFTGDDFGYVATNTFIRSMDLNLFKSAFLHFWFSNWHPLTWISHALDYALWGLNPLGHHLTNNILHAVNTCLVVLLVVKLIESANHFTSHGSSVPADPSGAGDSRFTLIAASTAGLLFGIHPLRVEAVAWIAERKELLCAFFYLLSIMAYVKYVFRSGPMWMPKEGQLHRVEPTRAYFLCLLFFVLALLSKPMAVTLPFVLLLLDWHPFHRIHSLKTFWSALPEKLPFIGLSLISSVLTVLAQEEGGSIISFGAIPPSSRLLVGTKSIFDYLWKMVLPLNLLPGGYRYPFANEISIHFSEYLLWIALFIGITIICAVFARRQKLWLSAWFYYLITLIPVLGIIKAGGMAMADRYTYLPSLGPSLVAGLLTAGVQEKILAMKQRRLLFEIVGVTAGITLVISLSLVTVKQIRLWKDAATIMEYLNRIRREEVMERFQKAQVYYNLGTGYENKGMPDKAIEEYLAALTIYPNYPDARLSLGNAYLKSGLPDKAIEQFQVLVALQPSEAAFRNALGYAYVRTGIIDSAIEHFTAAVQLAPSNPLYQANLRRTAAMKGPADNGSQRNLTGGKE